ESSTPGTYLADYTGVLVGSNDLLSVTVRGVPVASRPFVRVLPGAVDGSSTTINLGAVSLVSGSTATATIVARDAAGNVIPALASGAFSFALSGGTSTVTAGRGGGTRTAGP